MAGIITGLTTGLGLGSPSGLTGATAAAAAPTGKSLSIVGATGIVTLDNSDPLARQKIIIIRTSAAAEATDRRDLWRDDEAQQARDRQAVLGEAPEQSKTRASRRYKVTTDNSPALDRRYALSASRQLNTLLLQHELNGMSISDIKATGTSIVGQVIDTNKETVGVVVRNGKTTSYISTKRQTLDSSLPIMGIINKTSNKNITTIKTTEVEEPWYRRLL